MDDGINNSHIHTKTVWGTDMSNMKYAIIQILYMYTYLQCFDLIVKH